MNNSKITINVESIGADSIQANFKGTVRNYQQLISLGAGVVQTLLNSAVEIIKKNDDELDVPDQILQLTVLDAIVDKICNLVQTEDNADNEKKVDDFLTNILKGMEGDE